VSSTSKVIAPSGANHPPSRRPAGAANTTHPARCSHQRSDALRCHRRRPIPHPLHPERCLRRRMPSMLACDGPDSYASPEDPGRRRPGCSRWAPPSTLDSRAARVDTSTQMPSIDRLCGVALDSIYGFCGVHGSGRQPARRVDELCGAPR
jgi:hypothetical protein